RVSSYPANPRHFLFHSDALLHGRCWSSSHSADLLAWCYSFVPGVRAHGTQLRMSPRKTRGTWGFQQLPPACAEDEYRAWLVSELPVHAATKYREYLDNSAWMANLWIGWSLEFFVELFAHLHKGQDTKAGVDLAYKQTLSKHHNIRRPGRVWMRRGVAFVILEKEKRKKHKLVALRAGFLDPR
ncbi:unnamed protein product, partial [Prorocentrum cordatum]